MLLALDIGNTNIKIGVFDDADSNGYSPAATWRISSDRKRMADEYAATLLGLLALGGYSASDVSAAAILQRRAATDAGDRQPLPHLPGTSSRWS